MVVGVLRVVLALPGNSSLKGKRKVVRSALDRVKARFNAAAAEVDHLDDTRRAGLAFAVVSNDHSHANSMLDTIGSFVGSSVDAVVEDRALEIIALGGLGRDVADDQRLDDLVDHSDPPEEP